MHRLELSYGKAAKTCEWCSQVARVASRLAVYNYNFFHRSAPGAEHEGMYVYFRMLSVLVCALIDLSVQTVNFMAQLQATEATVCESQYIGPPGSLMIYN